MTSSDRTDAAFGSTPRRPWRYAGFWWRVFAFSIDNMIVGFITGIVTALSGPTALVWTDGSGFLWPDFHPIRGCLDLFAIQWLYFAGFECSAHQATPGKRWCHLIVTDTKGMKITFLQASGRYFGKYLSTFILGIGYLMAAFTTHKQALHDLLADTLVWRRDELIPRVTIEPDLQPWFDGER